ncbi:MAG: hypothetical protein ACYS76_09385 [Planctomycetota bacterium]|jgi:hypothetical protein
MTARKLVILMFAVCVGPAVLAAGKGRATALRDGSVLAGVDGRLIRADGNESPRGGAARWFFEFGSEFSDGRGRVKAGTRLEVLPSGTLGKMSADSEERLEADYRLWARITKYRGRNFIFPTDFLPVRRPAEPKPAESEESGQRESKPAETAAEGGDAEPAINEANDVLTIPEELMERLKGRRVMRRRGLTESTGVVKGIGGEWASVKSGQKRREYMRDFVLVDRIGFIRGVGRKGAGTWREASFALDSLGRGIQQVSFGLLPCEVLERAERRQSVEPDPARWRVSGIVTEYEGRDYLLLQKAVRVYSYGNFPR